MMHRKKLSKVAGLEAVTQSGETIATLADIASGLDGHNAIKRKRRRELSADPIMSVRDSGPMKSPGTNCPDPDGSSLDLKEQDRRFRAALNNMSQGVCMFDANHKMIVCNEKYVSLFGSDASIVKPGVALRDIFQHGVDNGIYPGFTADELLSRRLTRVAKGTISVYDQKMADGRTIEILISPMADGGWVATFADVTEIRRVEVEHAAAVAEIRKRNILLDATLESMAKGLCVFDESLCLLIHNQRYLDLFGLGADVLGPGTHIITLLKLTLDRDPCGSSDEAAGFYQGLEKCLETKTDWSVHRRLADDRIIAVSVRPMNLGGWIATFEDISERERIAEDLRVQHRRFDAALSNMSHGLSMFDDRLRLIVCNRRYLELYGMSASIVKPGATMLEILAHAAEKIPLNLSESLEHLIEQHVAQLAAGNHVMYRDLSDGRTVKVVHSPMADGGWVAIHEDVTAKKRVERYITYMASHDPLTDLANRTLFQERMEDALIKAIVGEDTFAILFLDLDNFKAINDTLGHPAGDVLLREVANRLRSLTSTEDTVARMGGDEFAILKFASDPVEIAVFAERLVATLAEPIVVDGSSIHAGVSIGIAIAPSDGRTSDDLIKSADLALYRAKTEGRGTFCFFEPGMDICARARHLLELDLRQALARHEFHLVFQPFVLTSDRKLTGFEALLRWNRPGYGLISPAEFIPIAEKAGLIISIGEWVIREACFEAARWPNEIIVAVNVSPVQFKKPGLVATIINALAASGLAPQRLELEITEAVVLQDDDQTLSALNQVRELGISISIDDFGVGYSSLSYLRSFPFDKIKIDRSFVSHLADQGKNFAIVRAIAELGKSLGVKIVAEGVETEEQLELVRRAGCNELQGYLLSQPRDAASIFQTIDALERSRPSARGTPKRQSSRLSSFLSGCLDRAAK